jgi:hypothetical protein
MAILVVATPWALTWADFIKTDTKPVDSAGESFDAFTSFVWDVPGLTYSTGKDGQLFYTGLNVITVTPNAQIFKSSPQTAALLSHEQFHYDVGIVTARAFALQLMAMRAPNLRALQMAQDNAQQLHSKTRSALIQRHYDHETHHGTDAHYQKIWKDSMAACLANPRNLHLQGFLL